MPKYADAKDMKRAIYYASRGIRTVYRAYNGEHTENVKDMLEQLDSLYIALKKEETSYYER